MVFRAISAPETSDPFRTGTASGADPLLVFGPGKRYARFQPKNRLVRFMLFSVRYDEPPRFWS